MSKAKNESHKALLKRFHTLCRVAGMSPEEKRSIIESCGVESSADIPLHSLRSICDNLSGAKKKTETLDQLRKRVIASIGGWLRSEGRVENINIIKGIACRATGSLDFNAIPAERLRNLYNLFLNKQNDKTETDTIVRQYVERFYQVSPNNNISN